MKITYKLLKENHACAEGLAWFEKHFPNGADSDDILDALVKFELPTGEVVSRVDWAAWLAGMFKLDFAWLGFIRVKGVRNGIYRSWHENGQLEEQFSYVDNKRHGDYKLYYENGQLERHYQFVDGWRHGDCKDWFENGQLWREFHYNKGVPQGVYKVYYQDGCLKECDFYVDGERIANHPTLTTTI